jgi:hypothetical protein
MRRWRWLERDCIWVGRSRGNCIWVYMGCAWTVSSNKCNCQVVFLRRSNVFFIISAPSSIARSQKHQRLHQRMERGRSTKTMSLLLHVCLHSQRPSTNQQTLHYSPLLRPRAHGIETEAALRDHRNCKLSCVVPLRVSVYWLLLTVLVLGLFAEWFWPGNRRKQIEKLDTFCAARRTSGWLLCDQTISFEREFFCGPCRSERNSGGCSFWILHNGGITDQRR